MTRKTGICREPDCNAALVFLRTPTGASMPCDAVSVGPDEWLYDKLRHVSHFKTCKNPSRFSGANRPKHTAKETPAMRTLNGHKVNGANERLEITVLDEPGHGGACHRYDITGFDTDKNPSANNDGYRVSFSRAIIVFQNGPIAEVGVNGITHEALLAILIDRLEGFQAGRYANGWNQEALEALVAAQSALQRRTSERVARGVEGTHTP